MHHVTMNQMLQPRSQKISPLKGRTLLKDGVLRLGVKNARGDSPTGLYKQDGGVLVPIAKKDVGKNSALARLNGVDEKSVKELQADGVKILAVGETISDEGKIVKEVLSVESSDCMAAVASQLDDASGMVKVLYAEVPKERAIQVSHEIAPPKSEPYVPLSAVW